MRSGDEKASSDLHKCGRVWLNGAVAVRLDGSTPEAVPRLGWVLRSSRRTTA